MHFFKINFLLLMLLFYFQQIIIAANQFILQKQQQKSFKKIQMRSRTESQSSNLTQFVRCPICYEDYTYKNQSIKVCSNNHYNCRGCIKQILNDNKLCAFCKEIISQEVLITKQQRQRIKKEKQRQQKQMLAKRCWERWNQFIKADKYSSFICLYCGNPKCVVQFNDPYLPKRSGLCYDHGSDSVSIFRKEEVFPRGMKARQNVTLRFCDGIVGNDGKIVNILFTCQQCQNKCERIYTYNNSLNGICNSCYQKNANSDQVQDFSPFSKNIEGRFRTYR